MNWIPIPVSAGGHDGKIFVDENAATNWVNGDLVITYTNTSRRGGLRFFNPDEPSLPPVWAQASVLVVGGGGGGGLITTRGDYGAGGGGGAGGFVPLEGLLFDTNLVFSIEVGKGGPGSDTDGTAGTDGGSSFILTNDNKMVEAYGGGGGGARCAGHDGGSGGGGSFFYPTVMPGGAGVAGQGFAGGSGISGTTDSAAGGGGAGGPGQDAFSTGGGSKGGEGRKSIISGKELWYAGGGGGAYINPTSAGVVKYFGGDGGSFDALANRHVGGNGAGVDGGSTGKELNPIPAQDGMDGRGGGGGGGASSDGATDERAGNGGSGVVIIRLSNFIVKNIPVPVPQGPFVYDGNVHTGVVAFFAYELTGTPIATNANVYAVTATLKDIYPDITWGDAAGGRAPRKLTWEINPLVVDVPTWGTHETRENYFTFGTQGRDNEEEKLAIDKNLWDLGKDRPGYPGETCATNKLPYCTLTGHRETNAGEYHFTATLVTTDPQGNFATNFVWRTAPSGKGRTDPWSVAWEIETAANAILSLSLESWQEGTTNKVPVSEWTWRKVMERYPEHYPHKDVVTYEWRLKGSSEPWDNTKLKPVEELVLPTEAGVYELRAFICKDSNHEPGNWVEAENFTTFFVWRHPSKTLSDWVDIQVTGCHILTSGSGLTDFPVLVRLKEPVHDGTGAITNGLPGFRYADVRRNGLELRFVSISNLTDSAVAPCDRGNPLAYDTLLPFEIDTWDPEGESLVWVKVPKMWKNAKFRMYWRRRDGAELYDDIKPSEVWANGYVGVWHFSETISAEDAPTARSADSSGNGHDAVPAGGASANLATMTSVPGMIGNARQNETHYIKAGGNSLKLTGTEGFDFAGKMTMSTWIKINGYTASTYPRVFSSKLNYAGAVGFEMELTSKIAATFRAAGNTGSRILSTKTIFNTDAPKAGWANVTFRINGTGTNNGKYYSYLPNCYPTTTYADTGTLDALQPSADAIHLGSDPGFQQPGVWGFYDETRLSNVSRSDDWVKAEFESVNNAKYCTFGLVNQLQGMSGGTDARAWVNWWSAEPWAAARSVPGTEGGRYWRQPPNTPHLPDPQTVTNTYFGALAYVYNDTGATPPSSKPVGTVQATYTAMPSRERVVFPTEQGAYEIAFTMANLEAGTMDYPGQHVIYTGDRKVDIEIVEDKPTPIDPTGPDGATLSGRVLTANDDTNDTVTPSRAIGLQSYWRTEGAVESMTSFWSHGGAAAPELGMNLLAGSLHTLHGISADGAETNALWTLNDVYIGNMMTNDAAAAGDNTVLSNRWNTLPWSPTSKAISTKEKWASGDPINHTEVGQLVMRNAEDAALTSQVFTNGVGTVYFDAVNAYALADVDPGDYQLVLEYDDPELDGTNHWRTATMTMLYCDGSSVSQKKSGETLDCLAVQNGGKTSSVAFYRVYAKLDRREPTRIRIRRTSVRTVPDEEVIDADDPDGFIVLDNVIVSWPTESARLESPGWYDDRKTGRIVLGMEKAFSTSFPTPDAEDLTLAAVYEGGLSPENVTSARLHYRWRYLNSHFDPPRQDRGDWISDIYTTAYLDPANGFRMIEPFRMNGHVGDIEYWFDMTAIVPYYAYVDYTGLGLDEPTGGYTEEVPMNAESHYDTAEELPSAGTNWFVRLRPGKSELERMVLRIEGGDDVDMELVGDHVWRGYLKTPEAREGGIRYRVEPRNWQVPGEASFLMNTNWWYAKEDADKLPVSAVLEVAPDETRGTNSWARIPCDGTTGYLMFQVDDGTRSVSVVRSDFQDFNGWDDARSQGNDLFVGNSTEDVGKHGVSRQKREFAEDFTYRKHPADPPKPWTDTPSANENWTETFEAAASQEYADYVPFGASTTLGGWATGPGMYVYQWYRYGTKIGSYVCRALQMEGSGKGWIQFPAAPDPLPRGIGTIGFRARLAQFIEPFSDASYADPFPGDTLVRTNYTFLTLAAFDTLENKGFSGNASVSLFAYYNDRVGTYELRVEQINASVTGSTVKGPGTTRRISLYRWKNSRSGGMTGKLLGSKDITVGYVKTAGETGKYAPMYISCCNEASATVVKAGVWDQDASGVSYNATLPGGINGKKFYSLVYRDDTSDRIAAGTYGVLSANCDGVFLRPHVAHAAISTGKTSKHTLEVEDGNVTFPALYSCEDDIRDSCDEIDMMMGLAPWVLTLGRMEVFHDDAYRWGVRADPTAQTLQVQVSPRGKSKAEWENVGEFKIDSFGGTDGTTAVSGTKCAVRLDRTTDYDVRIKVAGNVSDPRTDVVIDDLGVTQWRGCDYGDPDTSSFVADNDNYGWRTNFTFSSGWVTNKAVRLSAKRTAGWTTGSKASAIRSPLMDGDGTPKRGIGLGVISFKWRDAQENARILIQIATNNVGSSALGYDTVNDGIWTTVSNVDFSVMSPVERRRGGEVSLYLGLHGIKGLMRICVDPAVVQAVSAKDWLDDKRYGEVDITGVYCRDEPPLDLSSWWGWNLQTTDRDDRQYLTDEKVSAVKDRGLSLGLNRSTTENVEDDPATYEQEMPFVQTPTFLSSSVGEVSFRARKYELDGEQNAEVALYGAEFNPTTSNLEWHCSSTDRPLARFVISNTMYTAYSYKTKPGEAYRAFRLGVTGIPEVRESARGPKPTQGDSPVRVLIDEVLVSEAIRPRVGFRSCLPIRNGLMTTEPVPGAGTRDEQPILGDAWTVQAEIEVQQLPDEIDLTTPGHEPRVLFYWFSGERPWGFTAWRDQAIASADRQKAGRAELATADGETMLFRGSYVAAPGAVVMAEPSATKTHAIYQYAAEVVYWDKNGNCITGLLEQTEWTRPEWYAPLDLNRKNGGGARFSAYNILERIAPGRAWINEANVFDGRDESYEYPAQKKQYVEIALPIGQSLDGWRLNYIANDLSTNNLCVFGMDGVAAEKTANEKDGYVFLTVQSQATKKAKTLDPAAGEVDGTWYQFDPDDANAELDQTHPIGFQLVRPSGILAQEIVMSGTNSWAGTPFEERYSSVKRVETLNESDPEKQWLLAGDEYRGGDETTSLGVTNLAVAAERTSALEPAEMWTTRGRHSPGRINDGQVIPPEWAIYPSGDMAIVYATVEGAHIRQTTGGLTNVTTTIMLPTKKGGEGTNIVYSLDTWYEIDKITENDVVKASGGGDGFVFAAGKDTQDSVVRVKATARPRSDLREKYGLTPQNRYTGAVLDWLEKGHRLHGEKFEHSGNIDLPIIRDLAGNFITNLTLTETYWFDIDPTGSNWCFRAGTSRSPREVETHFSQGPGGRPVYDPTGTADYLIKTNIRMEVMMVITNEATVGKWAGKSWPPYVLRGIEPGSDSQQYARGETNVWESVNFKPTGDIQNGLPLRERWVPLRYFIFTEGSFDANNRSTVEVPAPYSSDSLGVNYGWLDFIGCQVFYSWSIDGRVAPVAIETLAPTNAITW